MADFSITDGRMNLRSTIQTFLAVDDHGVRWLLETKGAETDEVAHKDAVATQWCENATHLTKTHWQYLKIPQKAFGYRLLFVY